MNFDKYISAAKSSGFGLWKLNLGLSYIIPFNKPHRIKVKSISDTKVTTFIPYRRRNFNHIKGIHACGMATCAEFSSGLLLLSRLDPKKYRLIMESIEKVEKTTLNAIHRAKISPEHVDFSGG